MLWPREKAQRYGLKSLESHELLAIILKTGSKNKNVVLLAQEILNKHQTLYNLKNIPRNELQKINGLGNVKILQIQAMFEIFNRIKYYKNHQIKQLDNSTEAANYAQSLIGEFQKEVFLVVLLDQKNTIIHQNIMYIGTELNVSVNPKEIFTLCLHYNASKLYCFHNHPSNNLNPSWNDLEITDRLQHLSVFTKIKLIDHIIVGYQSKKFYSILQNK